MPLVSENDDMTTGSKPKQKRNVIQNIGQIPKMRSEQPYSIRTGGRRLRVSRARREQVVVVAGGQRSVQLGRRGCRGRARESGSERGWREVRASAPARPRRVRGRMRVSPRVMGRELAHVCRTDQTLSECYRPRARPRDGLTDLSAPLQNRLFFVIFVT